MTQQHILNQILPDPCSGEDALKAVKLLQLTIDEIWDAHGAEMAEAMTDDDLERLHELGIPEYDDIPF